MAQALFVYGLLMYPALCRRLTDRSFPRQRAVLADYARLTLERPGWPPIAVAAPSPGGRIDGVLLQRVDADSLRVLDLFEGVDEGLYRRCAVTVCGARAGRLPAEAYLAGDEVRDRLTGPWDERAFKQAYYAHYHDHVIPRFLRETR